MKTTLIATIFVLILGVAAFTQAGPFQSLQGPVAKVEEWSYTTEEKFGNTVEVWDTHSVTTYNTDRNPVESIEYTKTGSINKHYIRMFNNSGQLIQVEEYNWLGNLESKTVATYEGNVQTSRDYGAAGDLESAYDAELDANGNPIRITIYDVDSGDVSSVWERTYKSDGDLLSMRMYNDEGELSSTVDYRYGADGMDVISISVVYFLGSKFMNLEAGTMFAKIDAYGNWTEKRSYDHKERFGKTEWVLAHIYRRKITYR